MSISASDRSSIGCRPDDCSRWSSSKSWSARVARNRVQFSRYRSRQSLGNHSSTDWWCPVTPAHCRRAELVLRTARRL